MFDLLKGVRVVEVASMLCGDSAGMFLADLGAEVVKVENPAAPDSLRYIHGEVTPGNSPAHLQFNRNKSSVTLDLRQPQARSRFLALIAAADVLIDGTVGESLSRLGLSHEALREANPRIIHCQITGFGATGPLAELPTHGLMMSAITGAIPPEVEDGHAIPPGYPEFGGVVGNGSAPVLGGLYGAFSVVAALQRRDRTGQGAYIDVAASEAAVAGGLFSAANILNESVISTWLGETASVSRFGEAFGARYGYYTCRDGGVIFFGCIEGSLWTRFCRAAGRIDLLRPDEPRLDYAEGDDRLAGELTALFATRDRDEWVELAVQHRIPIGPVGRSLRDAVDDPYLQVRPIAVPIEHPGLPSHWVVGPPIRVENSSWTPGRAAPAPGDQNTSAFSAWGIPEGR